MGRTFSPALLTRQRESSLPGGRSQIARVLPKSMRCRHGTALQNPVRFRCPAEQTMRPWGSPACMPDSPLCAWCGRALRLARRREPVARPARRQRLLPGLGDRQPQRRPRAVHGRAVRGAGAACGALHPPGAPGRRLREPRRRRLVGAQQLVCPPTGDPCTTWRLPCVLSTAGCTPCWQLLGPSLSVHADQVSHQRLARPVQSLNVRARRALQPSGPGRRTLSRSRRDVVS